MRSEEQVEAALKSYEDVDSWKTIIFLYNAALKEVGTKLEILNDEFQHVHQYNPIEHIKTRIKTPDSIVKKLKRYGHETSIENMVRYVNDIAGVRLICSFTSDIYRLAEMIGNQSDLKVLSIKDYIKNPKESGYKSYHMLVSVPIFLSDSVVDTKVEIQIRTIAMDFWASLDLGFGIELPKYHSYLTFMNAEAYLGDGAVFALLGCAFFYYFAPRWNSLFLKLKKWMRISICILLTAIFVFDLLSGIIQY